MHPCNQLNCNFRALGMMSGTSLDGLDLTLCNFTRKDGKWSFLVEDTSCIEYDDEWRNRLTSVYSTPVEALANVDREYGKWLGEQASAFLENHPKVDLIASHGHTTHHIPSKGITKQIGSGEEIARLTGVNTIFDFRSEDVRLGGQGAPLVPIGDTLLFAEYDACINLGGFSNISFDNDGVRQAFDICAINFIMNPIAAELGKPFDENGALAKEGLLNTGLFSALEEMMTPFRNSRPSLSREWVERNVDPIVDRSISPADRLHTIAEHAAYEMSLVLNQQKLKTSLITGGGAYNAFLIDRLRSKTTCDIIIADATIIDFKEAIVFAFLGVLRALGETNVLRSVTGASQDSSSGIIAFPS